MKKILRRLQIFTLILAAGLFFAGASLPVKAYIQKQGTMNEAAVLRQQADGSSSQVMELSSGQEVTVNNELNGSDGTLWYQVFVNGSTMGYVPASTVAVSGTSNTGSNGNGNTDDPATQPTTQTTTVVEKIGTVTATGTVNVRSIASTSGDVVTSLTSGATFTVIDTVNGSDGYDWYQLEIGGSTGFVRSDLASVEEVTREVEVPSTEVPDVTAPAESPYSIISQVNAEGTTVWYLMDNTTGQSDAIENLLNPAEEESTGGSTGYKIAVVILLILLILAVAGATFLYFKWQDAEDFIDELYEKQKSGKRQQTPIPNAGAAKPAGKTAAPAKKPLAGPSQQTRTAQPQANRTAAGQQPQANRSTAAGVNRVQQTRTAATAQPGRTAAAAPARTTQTAAAQAKTAAPAQARTTAAQTQTRTAASPAQTAPQTAYAQAKAAAPKQTAKPAASTASRKYEPAEDTLPKASDILKTTKQELNGSKAVVKSKPTSGTWKSKNFLTDDDDLEFDFLDMDGDK